MNTLAAGDFTPLAVFYDNNRPGYSDEVIRKIIAIVDKPFEQIDFADVGAGTGIWTRLIARFLPHSVIAIEPNDAMRNHAMLHHSAQNIAWREGNAEQTQLSDKSIDILSMASSFHWANFDKAMEEFHRVLKPGGWFIAVWNPRNINNPLFEKFEQKINDLNPHIKRVSSGKSDFVEQLSGRLNKQTNFSNLHYLEGKHKELFNRDRYIGVWQSVNDVRVQLGEEKFNQFITYVKHHFPEEQVFECEYLTRAWMVQAI